MKEELESAIIDFVNDLCNLKALGKTEEEIISLLDRIVKRDNDTIAVIRAYDSLKTVLERLYVLKQTYGNAAVKAHYEELLKRKGSA